MPDVTDKPESQRTAFLGMALRGCLVALVVVVALPLTVAYLVYELALRLKFGRAARRGQFIIFVYSNSPNWKNYIEANLLPHVRDHAILLNWSERRDWDESSWPVRALQHWGGDTNYNPLAVVYVHLAHVRVLRFHQAFRDFKHGKAAPLHEVEAELLELVRKKTQA